MIRRKGAKIGDNVYVSGPIGDAYLGLKTLQKQIDTKEYETKNWLSAYHIPRPPFEHIDFVRSHATSALDISDGLVADAHHLAAQSDICIEIELTRIPLSRETQKWVSLQQNTNGSLVNLVPGGDDYQVLMSAPKSLARHPAFKGAGFRQIGRVCPGNGVRILGVGGEPQKISQKGYTHF
jgi:thiamine-monophosphate kinase